MSSRISRTASRTEAPEVKPVKSSASFPKISRMAGFFAASNAARRSCVGARVFDGVSDEVIEVNREMRERKNGCASTEGCFEVI